MKTQLEPPKFTHDCGKCVHLGNATINGRYAEFYACKTDSPFPELIYRHSSEAGDYGCTPIQYVSPLSAFASLALCLYVEHLDADAANARIRGTFWKDDTLVLQIKDGGEVLHKHTIEQAFNRMRYHN